MIHLIITSGNIPEAYQIRKSQYLKSIESCLKYAHLIDSYTVLECVSANEEYLNIFNTYYSKEKNLYSNKGLNEMNHLRSYLMQSNFNDSDVIIKFSGRYILKNSYFFEKVLEFHDKYDSIFKSDVDIYEGRGYHTFMYYMNRKLFLDTINNLDFSLSNDRPIEWDIKSISMKSSRNFEIDRLGVIAFQGTFSEMIFHC